MKKILSFMLALAMVLTFAACGEKNVSPEEENRLPEIQKYRTDYIGDAPKVSEIARLLPYPKDYGCSSIELQTDAEPYELVVYLAGEKPVPKEDFENCANMAFDLIGNMGVISFREAETKDIIASFTRQSDPE